MLEMGPGLQEDADADADAEDWGTAPLQAPCSQRPNSIGTMWALQLPRERAQHACTCTRVGSLSVLCGTQLALRTRKLCGRRPNQKPKTTMSKSQHSALFGGIWTENGSWIDRPFVAVAAIVVTTGGTGGFAPSNSADFFQYCLSFSVLTTRRVLPAIGDMAMGEQGRTGRAGGDACVCVYRDDSGLLAVGGNRSQKGECATEDLAQ